MLTTPAPFPFAGAEAFVRPGVLDFTEAQPCRITQRRADGRVSIALTSPEFRSGLDSIRARASGTRTVDLADLVATAEEAIPPAKSSAVATPKAKAKRQRRSAR